MVPMPCALMVTAVSATEATFTPVAVPVTFTSAPTAGIFPSTILTLSTTAPAVSVTPVMYMRAGCCPSGKLPQEYDGSPMVKPRRGVILGGTVTNGGMSSSWPLRTCRPTRPNRSWRALRTEIALGTNGAAFAWQTLRTALPGLSWRPFRPTIAFFSRGSGVASRAGGTGGTNGTSITAQALPLAARCQHAHIAPDEPQIARLGLARLFFLLEGFHRTAWQSAFTSRTRRAGGAFAKLRANSVCIHGVDLSIECAIDTQRAVLGRRRRRNSFEVDAILEAHTVHVSSGGVCVDGGCSACHAASSSGVMVFW